MVSPQSFAALAAVAILASFCAGAAAQSRDRLPQPPEGKQWKLVWNDEFNGRTLDETKWEVPPDAPRRDGWWMRQALSLDGKGRLVMRTLKDGDRYVDGCIRTRGKFEHTFGYYVCRVRQPTQVGHWPAFWLYNASVGSIGDEGRDGTEIDIFEKPWLTDKYNVALHWDGYGDKHRSTGKQTEAPGISKGWHTFSLWWSPEEYVFYVDGKEVWRTRDGGVCQVPLYIKLSDEIGSWAGDIKKATLPDDFLVDYVRVYDLVDR